MYHIDNLYLCHQPFLEPLYCQAYPSRRRIFEAGPGAFVAVICLISANAAVSSIAFQGALELAFIKAELARHENKEITKIVQVVPFLKKWRTPELCKNTPCKGEFSWKMTSLVDGAIRQLEFVRNLLCGQDEICSERPLKIMRVLMPPAKVEANTAIVDMRPLYDMYKRVAEEH